MKTSMKSQTSLLTGAFLAAALAGSARAGGSGFEIAWSSMDGGATESAGATFALRGTIGQPDAGSAAGGEWEAGGGYEGGPPPPPPCPADIDGSGVIGFGDLLAILSAWGACDPDCPEDVDASGAVGFGDLLVVLSAWGPCP
jgi:hypothetical protein